MSAVLSHRPSIRPMQAADLDAIMRIEPTLYSHPWTRGNFIDSLNSGYSAWVMALQGRVVGYALVMLVLDEAQLLNISVDTTYQGQGYGRILLAHMIAIARQHHALNIFLEVRVSNQKAIALYERMGFCEMSIRKGYYPAHQGREDALLMGMAL